MANFSFYKKLTIAIFLIISLFEGLSHKSCVKARKKLYLSLDVKNDFVLDFTVEKASMSKFFDDLFISIKSILKILLDAAYDSYDIFSKIKS